MKPNTSARSLFATLALAAALGAPPAGAAQTDLSPIPLGTASSTSVLPNLMFILDDSGSMDSDFLPDQVTDNTSCKSCTSGSCNVVNTSCAAGHPPFYATQFNTLYYNSQITYTPGVNSDGSSKGNATTPAASNDPYITSPAPGSRDLVANWTEIVWCDSSGRSGAELLDPTKCKRNGIHTTNPFVYDNTSMASPFSGGFPTTGFRNAKTLNTNPYYFEITPREHCTDIDMTTCALTSTPNVTNPVPAPVRWCKSTADAANTGVVTGTSGSPATARCQSKVHGNYPYPRLGNISRTDIVPATATYSNRFGRTDCAGMATGVCTYAEELQNFANWYTYYRKRMLTMKSAAGRVFSSMDDRYRIGFTTINATSSARYLKIDKFDVPHKAAWYTMFYDMTAGNFTPLRQALSRVGRHYAGMTSGINSFMTDDPIQYSCQQNFALLTTDGYWNSNNETVGPVLLNGTTAIGNQDNVVGTFVNRPTGTLDAAGTTVADTGTTRTQEQIVCTGTTGSSANFSGAPDANCNCSGNLKRVKQRTLDTNTTTTYVDGVQAGPPSTNTVSSFQDITACNARVVTTVTVTTTLEQVLCTATANANFSGTPDTPCGCSSGQSRVKQRTRTATQTVVTTDGAVTSNSTNTTNTFQNITSCGTTQPLISPNPTVTVTGPTVTSDTGATITSADFTVSPNPMVTTLPPSSTTTPGGSANTLADVAMFYYKTDLRPCPGGTPPDGKCITDPKATENVPTTDKDKQGQQHMVTFTLGLGLDGLMNYKTDYETATTGDFNSIRSGSTGCSFSPGGVAATCNWPQPVENTPTAIDDLWHAAVNGRGLYFSAKDPNQLKSGLTTALAAIKTTTGAAASSATSTPNVTPTDNFIYSSTYRTVKWDGEVIAEKIDVVTGAVVPGVSWAVGPLLDARSLPASDDRAIYTFDPSDASDKLKPFLYGNLTGTEAAYFDLNCTTNPALWPQCGAMVPADLDIANSGNNLVNYLRGQTQHAISHYRFREHTLGDTVNAKPAFLGKPNLIYGDAVIPDYNSFKAGPAASRTPVLFIASNDGMLHAFHGGEAAVGGGTELWAYVPRMLMPQLFKLAANNYDVNHRFYVDGSPTTMDVFFGPPTNEWKTILVGGLNAGGRGYYALDVTDTSNPKGLWEFTVRTSGSCASAVGDTDDCDLGYSYGQAIITKRPSDGKWVVIVTSGHNNVLPGDGGGYLYVLDAVTGTVLSKTPTAIAGTNVGDTTTPSGFAKISGFALNFAVNNTTTLIYGGDLLGNVWRFDLSTDAAFPDAVTAQRIGQAMDGSSPPKPQSITTKVEITRFDAGFNVIYVATGRFLGASDIQDPATLVPPLNVAYQQTIYGFKDTGTDLGDLRNPTANLVRQDMTLIDATNRTISNNAVDWSTKNGWRVDLNPANTSPGERVNIDIQLVRGVLLVAANEPNNEACSSGGNSFFYQFDYRSGSYLASAPGMVVGVKIGSALLAGFVVYRLPSGQLKYTGIDVTGSKQTGGVLPGGGGAAGRRATWRELYQ